MNIGRMGMSEVTSCQAVEKEVIDTLDGANDEAEQHTEQVAPTARLAFQSPLKTDLLRRRILPVHFSQNYLTLMPGECIPVSLEFCQPICTPMTELSLAGWNAEELVVKIS